MSLRDVRDLYLPEGGFFLGAVLLGLLLLALSGCATGPELGTYGFRVDQSCAGLGRTRLWVDEQLQGEPHLTAGQELHFDVTAGEYHEGRAQQLQGRLLEFLPKGAVVPADRPVLYLLRCPGGT